MDSLRRAQTVHTRSLARVAGEWVRYEYRSVSIRLRMVRGQSQFEGRAGENDYSIETRSIDWLVETALFVDATGAAIEPEKGGTITPEAGDGVFEVVPLANGMGWSPADGRGVRIRIHTQRVTA